MFSSFIKTTKKVFVVHQSRSGPFEYLSVIRRFCHVRNMSAVNLRWNYTPEEIRQETDGLINHSRTVYDKIGKLQSDELVYDNVVKALGDGQSHYFTKKEQLAFFRNVSTNKDIRDASVESYKKLSELEVELSQREDIFLNLVAAEKKFGDTLKPEAKRFLKRMIKVGQRNGLEMPKDIRDEIKDLQHKISNLEIDFGKNLNEENSTLFFTADELVGIPSDLVGSLKKREDGKLEVTLKYPHYMPCMMYAKNPETRRLLEAAFNSRCIKENTPILEELVKLRHKKATLLNFPDHASFVLEMRMAKTPAKVSDFLTNLEKKLQALKDEEMKQLLDYKREECAEMNIEFDGKINPWDLKYYTSRSEEKKYSVDQNKLKLYFPLDQVTRGLLRIYQDLLGLKFELVQGSETWHEDVEMYSVTDSETDKLMGYFYLDLFPREGKYGHACCASIQPGCKVDDGRQLTVSAMLANFTKPTESQPSLLLHSEVETYFHEFGHVMHDLCTEVEFAYLNFMNVEMDFIEAPSQMLENWVWCKESLRMMSGHYEDHSPIPEDLLDSLIKSRNANAGLFNCRQILLSTFDQSIHYGDQANIRELFGELMEKILGIRSTPGTYLPASFGHLGGGYDAQYYGYLWSEVFSDDMFHSKFEENVFDGKMGREYRRCILKPGGTVDAADMLQNFLGREPSQEPFLRSKGLEV